MSHYLGKHQQQKNRCFLFANDTKNVPKKEVKSVGKCLKTIQYLNEETGEMFERQMHVDMQYNEDGYLLFKNKKSIKNYFDTDLPKEFSWSERGRIQALTRHIIRDNQLLVYRSGGTIKPITVKNIEKIIDSSHRQALALLKKMDKYGVVKQVKIDGLDYYCFNPLYGMKDKRLTLTVFIIFQHELKTSLPAWVYQRFIEDAEELRERVKVRK